MMNKVWAIMFTVSIICGVATGKGELMLPAMLDGASSAVTLCVSLCGAYMFWLGMMEVAKDIGAIEKLAKYSKPFLSKLFPNAQSAVAPITLNLAANFFGMGSAATPFGLSAMKEMQRLNKTKERATDDMCMFIALNASALELLPTGVLALRTAAGSTAPYSIVVPTFIASVCSFVAAILLAKLLCRFF